MGCNEIIYVRKIICHIQSKHKYDHTLKTKSEGKQTLLLSASRKGKLQPCPTFRHRLEANFLDSSKNPQEQLNQFNIPSITHKGIRRQPIVI